MMGPSDVVYVENIYIYIGYIVGTELDLLPFISDILFYSRQSLTIVP